MCLNVDLTKTLHRKKGKPTDKIKIYKSFREPTDGVSLLRFKYRSGHFDGGLLVATPILNRKSFINFESIAGGAIHCCTSKREIKRFGKIKVEGWAYRKDLIAIGQCGDACFSKVFLPKKNCLRAIREYKAKQRGK